MAGLVKLGPWGGNVGNFHDITGHPTRLTKIEIYSSDRSINSIAFSYLQEDGTKISAGPWGNPEGSHKTLEFQEDEYPIEMNGTTGPYGQIDEVVRSLNFVTNKNVQFGSVGVGGGTPFSVPIASGRIVAFFGRFSTLADAIGIYVAPN